MRLMFIFGAVTLILISCQSQDWGEEMRLARADAGARQWMFELNQSEARYESRSKGYGRPQEFHMMPAPEGYFAEFKLADVTAYTATLRPTDKRWDGYFTDQSMIIRRCPRPQEPTVSCPAIDEPVLIAPRT